MSRALWYTTRLPTHHPILLETVSNMALMWATLYNWLTSLYNWLTSLYNWLTSLYNWLTSLCSLCPYIQQILLADILPALIIKLTAPYVMHYIPYWWAVVTACVVPKFSLLPLPLSHSVSVLHTVLLLLWSRMMEWTGRPPPGTKTWSW